MQRRKHAALFRPSLTALFRRVLACYLVCKLPRLLRRQATSLFFSYSFSPHRISPATTCATCAASTLLHTPPTNLRRCCACTLRCYEASFWRRFELSWLSRLLHTLVLSSSTAQLDCFVNSCRADIVPIRRNAPATLRSFAIKFATWETFVRDERTRRRPQTGCHLSSLRSCVSLRNCVAS